MTDVVETHNPETCKVCAPILNSAPYKRGVAKAIENAKRAEAEQ